MRTMMTIGCALLAMLWLGCGSSGGTGSGDESGDDAVDTSLDDAPTGDADPRTFSDGKGGGDATGDDDATEDVSVPDVPGPDVPDPEDTDDDATEDAEDPADTPAPADTEGDTADTTPDPGDIQTPDVGTGDEDSASPTACGSNLDCEGSQVCDLADCLSEGSCVADPGGCPENLAPECGCDDITYDNACERLLAGVGLQNPGVCSGEISPGVACVTGTPICGPGQFCKANGCGIGLTGECAPKSTNCGIEQGACGCDGNTYASKCAVYEAGVNYAGSGGCPSEELNCTVALNAWSFGEGCALGEYCMGGCECEGFCAEKQIGCSGTLMNPVCSCGGQTYGNDCVLLAAGKNMDYEGVCEGDSLLPEYCNQLGNDDTCAENKKCNIQSCDAEATGTCMQVMPMCISFGPEECGCNGQTYFNVCARVQAGAAKKHDGPCNEDGSLPTCNLGVQGECADGLYCSGLIGQCTGVGICKQKDFICVLPMAVCGCDGNDYGSPCNAHKVDVPVQYIGECN